MPVSRRNCRAVREHARMTRLLRSALVAAALAPLAACSSGSSTDSTAPKPSPSAKTVCGDAKWPQKIPDTAKRDLTAVTLGDPGTTLTCFNVVKAVAPDGHNVLDDAGEDVQAWTVVSSSPAAGTSVNANTPITLRLTYPN